jgi:hypothetical protein
VRAPVLALVAAVAVSIVSACGAPPEPAEEPPHGYVAGAEETAEAQPRLVVAGAGVVRVLDLVTEDVHEVARVDATSLVGDGRHAFVGAADGSIRIVDGGSWMVDHGDHVHYYRAPVREVGAVPSGEPVAVHGDPAVTALTLADGAVRLLDRTRLDEGGVAELATIPRSGPAVPYGGHVLVTAAEQVAVHDRAGAQVATIAEPCPQPEGAAVTRRGTVFGCADGALLVTEAGGAFRGEKLPYPRLDVERAREFRHRPGGTTLTAIAGEAGVWVLDVAIRTWAFHGTGPVVAVNTAGAGTAVLTLTADGVLHALDPASGQELARNPLLAAPVGPGATIEVDTSRAYVNDPATGVIHEIDYGDGLRVARTFDLGGAATHMVETGR